MNFQLEVAGRSLMYRLNKTGTRTKPCGRLLPWDFHELHLSPTYNLKRLLHSSSSTGCVNQYGTVLLTF